jgi:hypothetical protein
MAARLSKPRAHDFPQWTALVWSKRREPVGTSTPWWTTLTAAASAWVHSARVETTALYRVLREHLATFEQQWVDEAEGRTLPAFVTGELRGSCHAASWPVASRTCSATPASSGTWWRSRAGDAASAPPVWAGA